MMKFRSHLGRVPASPIFRILESDVSKSSAIRTACKTRGGFDNDIHTMNDVLHSVLRKAPEHEFSKKHLKY